MFSKKKEAPQKRGGGEALMKQMGFSTDLSSMEAMVYGDVEEDAELEAELLALQGEEVPKSHKKGVANMLELDRMVAASLRDLPSDEEVSDTEDPDLMEELMEMESKDTSDEPPRKAPSPMPPSGGSQDMVAFLDGRISMYRNASEAAKSAGDSRKAKRMDRGIKDLQDLLRKAKTGKPIDEDEIPPPVAVSGGKAPPPTQPSSSQPRQDAPMLFEPTTSGSTQAAKPAPPKPAPSPPKPAPSPPKPAQAVANSASSEGGGIIPNHSTHLPPAFLTVQDGEKHRILTARRDQYKVAALHAKHQGNSKAAVSYIKTAKQFDRVIIALEEGKPIDLTKMPPPPPGVTGQAPEPRLNSPTERNRTQGMMSPTNVAATAGDVEEEIPETNEEEKKKFYQAPSAAGTVLEALQQRLDKYKSAAEQAKEDGNSSKARRMGRIVKDYESAIKANKAGKPFDYDDLPAPPGFPPIPTGGGQAAAASPKASSQQAAAARSPSQITPDKRTQQSSVSPGQKKISPGGLQRQTSLLSRAEQQAIFLQDRQLQFKKAALQAKNNGDIELAKKYMRMAKGFDQMIEAARSGLPVDMSQVPPPPGGSGNEKLEFVPEGENEDMPTGDRNEQYKKLEQDLIQQIRTCTSNSEHFSKLGDVSSASKFEKMLQNARRDLDALKNAFKHGDPVPRFHYENRSFSLVQSNSELGDNDLEIILIRGINYGLPSDYSPGDLDTYIKYEFPYPNDNPQNGTSDTCKGSNSPEYNHTFKVTINRKARSFLRILKSKAIKLEIYYKRGFFKSDKLLGTVSIKLLPLENQCTVHESYDLVDKKKSVGGKLEVKVRVRDPFQGKQVEEVKERWLIIDHFERTLKPQAPNPPRSKSPSRGNQPFTSMEVLKYEKQLLDRQIQLLQREGRLSGPESDALVHKSRLLAQRVEDQREVIRKGGLAALKDYADAIERTQAGYVQEAQALVKQGNREKAQTVLNKKKYVEKEVEAIRAKLAKS